VDIYPCREVVHASQLHLHRVEPSMTAAGERAKTDAQLSVFCLILYGLKKAFSPFINSDMFD